MNSAMTVAVGDCVAYAAAVAAANATAVWPDGV